MDREAHVRLILEAYRWVTLAAFLLSGAILSIPIVLYFLPGSHVNLVPGTGAIGMVLLAVTFATSGFNVIGIAIYDQLRALTTEAEYARTEIAYLREELRER